MPALSPEYKRGIFDSETVDDDFDIPPAPGGVTWIKPPPTLWEKLMSKLSSWFDKAFGIKLSTAVEGVASTVGGPVDAAVAAYEHVTQDKPAQPSGSLSTQVSGVAAGLAGGTAAPEGSAPATTSTTTAGALPGGTPVVVAPAVSVIGSTPHQVNSDVLATMDAGIEAALDGVISHFLGPADQATQGAITASANDILAFIESRAQNVLQTRFATASAIVKALVAKV